MCVCFRPHHLPIIWEPVYIAFLLNVCQPVVHTNGGKKTVPHYERPSFFFFWSPTPTLPRLPYSFLSRDGLPHYSLPQMTCTAWSPWYVVVRSTALFVPPRTAGSLRNKTKGSWKQRRPGSAKVPQKSEAHNNTCICILCAHGSIAAECEPSMYVQQRACRAFS